MTCWNSRVWGGKPWDKTRLHKVLTNVVYTGRVSFKGKEYAGEHEGIVDPTDGSLEAADHIAVTDLVQHPVIDQTKDFVGKMKAHSITLASVAV